jgi:hypothetical protein
MIRAWTRWLAVTALIACVVRPGLVHGQAVLEGYRSGQNVTPLFEGWEQNPDGSFNMVFAYYNVNWDEEVVVPIGPANSIEPGGPDQGQPTRFMPRRNQYVFRVRVPNDFGKKELIWTLTAHGQTERAYATLKPEYIIDRDLEMANSAGGAGRVPSSNQTPTVRVDGEKTRTVKAGERLTLIAYASDDGVPKPQPSPLLGERRMGNPQELGRHQALGLRAAWFVYRGAGDVFFEPDQFKVYQDTRPLANSPWTPGWTPPPLPPDGTYMVSAVFKEPGTYVLRWLAHDGGLHAHQDVTVMVTAR